MISREINRTILVIDDDRQQLTILSKMLEDAGYIVETAQDGTLGYQIAVAMIPALILLDMGLPDLSGDIVCTRLKQNPPTAQIPILFLSGQGSSESIVRGFEAGAVDYIAKPFRLIELLARVKTHLELYTFQMEQKAAIAQGKYYLETTQKLLESQVVETKQLEEEICEVESKCFAITQAMMDGFWISDIEGKFLEVNDVYCKMSGYTREELLSKNISDIECFGTSDTEISQYEEQVSQGQRRFEILHRRKDGSTFLAEVSSHFQSTTFITFIRDITIQKESETKLLKEQQRFRSIFTASPVGLLLLNRDTVVTDLNQSLIELILRNPLDVIGKRAGNGISCVHSTEDLRGCGFALACSNCLLRRTIETVVNESIDIHGVELPIELALEGNIVERWIRIDAEPLELEDGSRVIVAVADITHEKEVEKEIVRQKEEIDRYFNLSRDLLLIARTDGVIERVNPEWERVLGRSISELEGSKFFDLVHPDDIDITVEAMALLDSQIDVTNFINRYRAKDGSYLWLEWRANPSGSLIYAVARDITSRKATELALEEEKVRLANIIEGTQAGTWEWNIQTGEGDINDRWAEMLGYSREELLPITLETFRRFSRPEDVAISSEIMGEHFAGKRDNYEFISRKKHRDGHWIWVLGRGKLVSRTESGEPLLILGSQLDISNLKEVEQKLLEKEEILTEAQEIAHIGSWELEIESGELCWSSEIFNIFEQDSESFAATYKNFQQMIHPDDRDMVDIAYKKSVRDGVSYSVTHRLLMNDGRIKFVHERCRHERDENGFVIRSIGTVQDITTSKLAEENEERLKEQLYQSQKMDAVGQLAGGVAHDFNNMLGVILSHSEELLFDIKPDNPLFESVNEIKLAAQRSAGLTRQLLAFSRLQPMTPKKLDLNDTIETMLRMLRRLIGEHIIMQWNPTNELTPLFMDPGQIDQILANLCVNARDAMTGPGMITIKTDSVLLNIDFCRKNPTVLPGEYIKLSVADTGCGMEESVRRKIFEPFFTTKGAGKGTGLGLSTVYGITQQNGGTITVESSIGKGSTFSIYLPRQENSIVEEKSDEFATPHGGDEKILLVEDEEMLLRASTRILLRSGYTVFAVTNFEDALSAVANNPDISLLISDVIMPEINGKELSREIAKLVPGIKVLFVSGYTSNVLSEQGLISEDINFLQKPFQFEELLRKTRDVLDQ